MEMLLNETGIIDNRIPNVVAILKENDIKTVSDLLAFKVDALQTTDLDTKNQLRGLKDLLLFRYKGKLIPSEVYLSTNISIKEDIDRNLIVNYNGVNFSRMGFSEGDIARLHSWAQIMYIQYATKELSVIDLFESYINYNGNKGGTLILKLKMYLDYYYNYNYQLAFNVNSIEDLVNLRGKMLYLEKRKKEIKELRSNLMNRSKRGAL